MKKRSIRRDIIDTAARLFYKQGYCNTGINQIIEEAGIAKTSLYQYFNSKEDLLVVYLEESGIRTYEALQQAIATVESPRDKMIAVFGYLETLVQQKEFSGCNFLNIVYEIPEQAIRVKEQIKLQKDSVRKLFAETLKPIDKEMMADELYMVFEGALIGNKVHNDVWPILSAKNIVKKLI